MTHPEAQQVARLMCKHLTAALQKQVHVATLQVPGKGVDSHRGGSIRHAKHKVPVLARVAATRHGGVREGGTVCNARHLHVSHGDPHSTEAVTRLLHGLEVRENVLDKDLRLPISACVWVEEAVVSGV